MKTCSKCGKSKETTEFYVEKRRPVGACAECKECIRKRTSEWNRKNADKKAENNRNYKFTCTPGLLASYVAKRNAAQLARTPKWLSIAQLQEIEEFYFAAKELGWLSDGGLHVDHIVPLQGKNVSGLHVPWNLQIIPASDNFKKNNRF